MAYEPRPSYATVTSIVGDWEDDWFEDYEEGDELGGGEVSTSFGPRHPGGANFTDGDGSVRFIAQGIAPRTWSAANSPSSGEVLGSD